ncbi:hypothetical protein [Rhizobium hidalgonense]|uniref:hypothetical protein n=1 Tax=Rhizobium hidalgonense TaxID=1538159 RepID=UPI0002E18253|nr:hypothetical protein [Rhizobium hidalgonense]
MLARTFERIHRSNLIGMGILPLRLPCEYGPQALKLTAGDVLEIRVDDQLFAPRCPVGVNVRRTAGDHISFSATAAIKTMTEVETLKAGGIHLLILRDIMAS